MLWPKRQEPTEQCHVADQFCTACVSGEWCRGVCYVCGLSVCRKCSSKRKYRTFERKAGELVPVTKLVRMCNDCQIDLDGDERVVMRRLLRLAGYKPGDNEWKDQMCRVAERAGKNKS